MKIAIQTGMAEIEAALTAKGYEVVPFREGGTDIKMTILNDIDEEYEEIDPVTFMGEGDSAMILLDASRLSQSEILTYCDKYMKA